jgi:hypothetical protein
MKKVSFMKRKIIPNSEAAPLHLPGGAHMSHPGAAWVSEPAGRRAAPSAWKSPLRRAWLAALQVGRTNPLTKSFATACVTLAACAAIPVGAQILTTVPMQGSMLMPEVFYHEDTDTVTVDLWNIITNTTAPAQLTPLLISNPTNRFSPADPWFDSLDPSRQGLAFSRRYGFTPATGSGTLPTNRQLWIRKLSGPPDLGFYDYRNNQKIWTPIFGTAGASSASAWTGKMWHVGVTAPPGTNAYAATFEVYVVDTDTGMEVPGSSSAPFVLDWTDVPDGRPPLNIAAEASGQVRLSWPASATNWAPVCASAANASDWSALTNESTVLDGMRTVLLDWTHDCGFFRMRLNP